MALIDLHRKEITCKLVYYGTGLGGKTANLKYIYNQLAPSARGEFVSLATETERTLYFDYLGLDLGQVQGFKTKFSLYTVPGQVEYNASRKLILNGVDGIIFVADSDVLRRKDNIASLQNMVDNMRDYSLTLDSVAWVLQYNKRDLKTAMNIGMMEDDLNMRNVPSFEAIASEGLGVFATLRQVSKLVLNRLQ
jgi:mutual gliding-motility protein MglA